MEKWQCKLDQLPKRKEPHLGETSTVVERVFEGRARKERVWGERGRSDLILRKKGRSHIDAKSGQKRKVMVHGEKRTA